MSTPNDHPDSAGRSAGWYQDPRDPRRRRYWDGKKWSELAASSSPTPQTGTPEGATQEAPKSTRPADRRSIALVACAVLVVLVAIGVFWSIRTGGDDAPNSTRDLRSQEERSDVPGPDTSSEDGTTAPSSESTSSTDPSTAPSSVVSPGESCHVDETRLLDLLEAHPPLEPFVDGLQVSGTTCSGDWASTVVKASDTDSALALFKMEGGEWTLVLVGSSEPCSGLGIPVESEAALGCPAWG